jgi:hypothetical protein
MEFKTMPRNMASERFVGHVAKRHDKDLSRSRQMNPADPPDRGCKLTLPKNTMQVGLARPQARQRPNCQAA